MNTKSLLSIAAVLAALLGFAVPAALPEMLATATPEAYEYATPDSVLDSAAATAANMFFQ